MKMKDDNCIFCKLANGEIPTATLYEDEDFRVILDASPASKGHALIIPKEHYANLYELDDAPDLIWFRIMWKQQDRLYSISIYI